MFETFRKGPLPDVAATSVEDADEDEWNGEDGDDSVHEGEQPVDPKLVAKHKREKAQS